MALNYKKIWNGVTVVPKTTSTSDLLGELETLTSDSKIYFHNGTINSPLVTEAHAGALTNKTIVVASNTITTAASGNLVATELNAALAELDGDITTAGGNITAHINDATDAHDASAISNVPAGTIAATDVQAAINELDGDIQAHINDTVDAHDASAISVVPTGNLAATEVQAALNELQGDINTINTNGVVGPASATDEAIARFDGTTGKLIQNSVVTITDAGVAAGFTGLTSSGTVSSTGTLAINGDLTEALTTDAATTGANATVTNPATPFLRLTNASLTSVDMISAPVNGEVLTIVNATGVDITINNNLGGTAANRILTGTKANLTLKDEASIIVKYDSTEARWMVIGGTGAGSTSVINYDANPMFESGTTGYNTYEDAAAAQPVDGTGGTPETTLTVSTVSPLRGLQSGLFSKPASNEQGEGFSYDFTIDPADQAKIIRISFDYSTSTNYVDDDMRVYIYDITNAQIIEVIDRTIYANTNGQYVGSFQTASNSTSYRLILHVASVNANDYTMKIDNVIVGPQTLIKGPVVTDEITVTPVSSWTTNTTPTGSYRRIGDKLEGRFKVTLSGAPTATTLTFTLPNGLNADTTKQPLLVGNGIPVVGTVMIRNTTTNLTYSGRVFLQNATTILVGFDDDNATGSFSSVVTATAPFTFVSGDAVEVKFSIPIAGWSSNVQLSEDAGNRLIAAYVGTSLPTGTPSGSSSTVVFPTMPNDTTASYSSSTGLYTVPETGFYDVSASVEFLGTFSVGNDTNIFISLDSSTTVHNFGYRSNVAESRIRLHANGTVFARKGQTISIRSITGGAGVTYASSLGGASLSIHKIATPQTLAGSETVAVIASTDAGQSIATATETVVKFEDKEKDTHNAYNGATGEFTCPVSGVYHVSTSISFAPTATFNGTSEVIDLYAKVGATYKMTQNEFPDTRNYNKIASLAGNVVLTKGQVLTIATYQNSGGSLPLAAAGSINYLSITRVGN